MLPPKRPSGTRFVADAMLGSLARKLRAFGFDTSYFREGNDADLLALARSEERVLLTSDRSLAELARARAVPVLTITGSKEGARILSLRRAAIAGGVGLQRGPPMCSVCNGSLVALGRAEAAGHVPLSVTKRHRLFFRCEVCGRYYWRGAHWKKLRWLERRLGEKSHGTFS